MPIHIDETDTQVDVQTSDAPHEPERQQPGAEALPRWQQLAARNHELEARTSAWNFED
jgi:hypothetical protein